MHKSLRFLVLALALSPVSAAAELCGDVDLSGELVATDALMTLRAAVQLPQELECPTCIFIPPSVTSSTGDECFDDEECASYGHEPHCGGPGGYKCVECDNDDDHCEPGNVCTYYHCTNACGDFDDNGSVGAIDALRVLRNAVGMETPLVCPGCEDDPLTTTTSAPVTSSSMFPGDECFQDADCWDDHPGWHCGGSTGAKCVQCQISLHCGDGFLCAGYSCVPE